MREVARFRTSVVAPRHKRKAFLLSTIGAITLSLVVPAAVLADFFEPPPAFSNGMTIELSGATTAARGVLVNIDGSITCDTLPGPAEPDTPFLTGWAKQAIGQRIAFGMNAAFNVTSIICDGTPHSFTVQVSADQAGVPFKGGSAAVAVSSQVCAFDPEVGFVCRRAATGWVVVRFRG